MNKTRAMLDALMGPGRDVLVKDKGASKEKFKDQSVCKNFLIGMCPHDKDMLGGKRKFAPCDKLHSELMKDQYNAHPDFDRYQHEYEKLSLQELEFCTRECETHIANERQRIREDLRRKKPALPGYVNDKLAIMKRESSAMIQRAETLDDDQLREKEALITKANEIMKDREDFQEAETKKAIEAIVPEEVCEICGVSFMGKDGDAAHQAFRIHDAYRKIRAKIKELRPRIEEREQKKIQEKEREAKKKRKEEWEEAAKNEGKEGRNGDNNGAGGRDRDRDKDREAGRRDRSRDRDRRDRRRSRSRRRSNSRDRSRSRGRRRR